MADHEGRSGVAFTVDAAAIAKVRSSNIRLALARAPPEHPPGYKEGGSIR